MDRRRFLASTGGSLFAMWCGVALAQRAGTLPRIGLLWNDAIRPSPLAKSLLDALSALGYAADRNLAVEDRISLEGYSDMTGNASALVRAKVDVIVAYGATATFAAARATREIPIVAIVGADPVANGLAASLARPGGNVTGIATLSGELHAKRIELLKALVPDATRLGMLVASEGAMLAANIREVEAASRKLGLQTQVIDVRTSKEIEPAIEKLVKARVAGIYISTSTMMAANRELVVRSIERHRIPAVYGNDRYVDAGGLVVYSTNIPATFVRAASYVDRILKGARAAELPFEQSREIELTINLRTGRKLGIAIPNALLLRADRVIE
jgi:putative ABC transport system substrate-binding protein